jgi:hypothetical protein
MTKPGRKRERWRMCRRTLVIIAVLIAVCAAWARAQHADAITTKVLKGTITGTNTGTVAGRCSVWAVMDALWLTPDDDYDNNNNWHDAYWWHQNDSDFYANHPQWISWQPNWRDQDGACRPQHKWHYGQWWYNQNPNWVSISHPNWISQHRNWANHSEPQDHRAAMRTESAGDQRNPQQQTSIQQDQANQQKPAQRVAAICVLLLALRSGLSP